MTLRLFFAVFGSLLPYLIPWPGMERLFVSADSADQSDSDRPLATTEPDKMGKRSNESGQEVPDRSAVDSAKPDGAASDGAEDPKAPPKPGVHGVVSWSREAAAKPRVSIDQSADPVCVQIQAGKRIGTEDSIVREGRVQNAVVFVSSGLSANASYPLPEGKPVLDQRGCTYRPHVLSIMTSQPLIILNSDPTLHNVHGYSSRNPQFNFGQPKQGMQKEVKFSKAEMISVKCDVHPWMNAWIAIFDHPFHAVTNEKGEFSIPGLPPGNYEITAWHEVYGEFRKTVTIEKSEAVEADFTMDWAKAKR